MLFYNLSSINILSYIYIHNTSLCRSRLPSRAPTRCSTAGEESRITYTLRKNQIGRRARSGQDRSWGGKASNTLSILYPINSRFHQLVKFPPNGLPAC